MAASGPEVISEMFARVNRRDLRGTTELWAEDAELVIPESFPFRSGTFRGYEGLRTWFGDWFQEFEMVEFDLHEVREIGEAVLARAIMRGVGRASGVETQTEVDWIYRLRDGRISYAELCDSPGHAEERAAEIG